MFGGIEKPPTLADWASNGSVCLFDTMNCWIHAYHSFFSDSMCDFKFCMQTIPCSNESVWRGFDRRAQGVEAGVSAVCMGLTMTISYRDYCATSITYL